MSASASLSTHVLDTHRGRPAAALGVSLHRIEGARAVHIVDRRTDDTGRIADLGKELAPGTYRLTFDVDGYFADTTGLFRSVSFDVALAPGHHHIPLLISPFACVSYRGA